MVQELEPVLNVLTVSAPYLCAVGAFALFGILIVTLRVVRNRRGRFQKPPFDEHMAALGLEEDEHGAWDGMLLGRRIRVLRFEDARFTPPSQLEVSTIVPTGRLRVVGSDPDSTTIRGSRHVGDSDFDPLFEVDGELEELAVLTAEVRRTLRNAARYAGPRIEQGWLTLSGPGTAELDSRIAPLVAVASAVEASAASDPTTRIRRFADDPHPGVRARCLEILSNRPPSAMATAVAQDRLEDPDPIVQTLAAVLARDAGKLVSIAQSGEQPNAMRKRAAKALMHGGSNEARIAAATALASGPSQLHAVAYELCEPLGAQAEPVLIALVGSSNQDVARGAAEHLGKIGSIRAMPALKEFQERSGSLGGPIRPELAKAISQVRGQVRKTADEPTRPLLATPEPHRESDEPNPSDDRRTPAGRTIRRGRR